MPTTICSSTASRTSSIKRQYGNVREWIADINDAHALRPRVPVGDRVARDRRLLHGGVKNLLSGVTTVAHHDPLYAPLSDACYPIRVVASLRLVALAGH